MNKKLLQIILAIVFLGFPGKYTGGLTTEDKPREYSYHEEVKKLVDLYVETFINFAYSPNRRDADLYRLELGETFEGLNNLRCNDLPQDFMPADYLRNSVEFEDYLTFITSFFYNKLKVSFGKPSISDCIDNNRGVQYVTVSISKTFRYKKQSRTVQNIWKVNISRTPPKINVIGFPDEFQNEDCAIDNLGEKNEKPAANQMDYYAEFKDKGDFAFEMHNYVTAQLFYKKALFYRKNDTYLKTRLAESSNFISKIAYRKRADEFFSRKQFQNAKEYYQKALKITPDDSSLQELIGKCHFQIREENYHYYINQADKSFDKQYFGKAQTLYARSLEYRPNDSYARDKIIECRRLVRLSDRNAAKTEIKRAKRLLATKGKKAFPEAFRIFDDFKDSDFLDADAYYLMARIMDGCYGNVKKKMRYDSRNCCTLARLYCLKSKQMGSEKAEEMWSEHFNKKSRNCK